MPHSKQAADCLSGGGAMGALMRALEWSKTPVGAVETWPQSLRTAVSMVLESRFPMYIAWGDSYTQFYNDRYRPILGSTKHPAALGLSTRETFREIWSIIGPMFDGVMQGTAVGFDDFMLPLDRHGFVEECYFIFSYSPIRDESGRVGGVLVTVTETTERVLGERRLKTLRELSARTVDTKTDQAAATIVGATLAENAADLPFALLYLSDADGVPALAAAARIRPEAHQVVCPDAILAEVIRTRSAIVFDVPSIELPPAPDQVTPRQAIALAIAHAGEDRAAGVLVAGLSARLVFDAPYRSFLDLVAAQIASAIASARAFQEAKARAEALAEIDRAKTAFFSNISHEFRTPLTLMLGPMEDALASGHLAPEDLRSAHRNALRLLKLVNSLLDFSRIEAGRVQASFEQVDLGVLTTDISSQFRAAIERAGLRLTVACDAVEVFVDREMWEKIVLNLLSNALKFTFEGEIAVELRARGGTAELVVRDTGIGVPEAEVPRLFERFHRVEGARSRTHEGSGIGLALVQELVKMHGGTVTAESALGTGTTFVVSLPTGSAHLPQERIGAQTSLASTAIGSAPFVEEALRWLPDTDLPISDAPELFDDPTVQPARILLADDNADMRAYVRRLLSKHWTIESVADGEAALAAMQHTRFDLVVTDVMMPRIDGYQLLRALRADPATASIPVVMVSARAGEEARLDAIGLGVDDYLVKPFSARELVARVKSQLALASARRAVEAVRDELYQLFMQAPAPICVLRGPKLVFEMANPLYEQVSGRRALVGKPLLVAMPELAGQGFDELLHEVMRTGVAHLARETPVRLDRRNAGQFEDTYFTFVYAPMRASDGSVDRVMVFCTEDTAQVVARRAAESANRAKDEFLAMLGHELRNPLAPILTALQLMQLRDSEASKKERAVIERHIQHLVHLVDDLLDVARIARGSIDLKRAHVEIGEVVARGVEMSSLLIEQRRHSLQVSVPSRGLTVDGDPNRLAQVVSNLLTNAAKYTPPEGRISVTAFREDHEVVLSVRDNGVGIAPEMLPRIFELFAQEQQSIDRSQGGLGLGLAIVRNLVTMHGGTIAARSAGRGRGSELTVRLPLVVGVATPEPALEAARTETQPGALRVLVVDDNIDAADLLVEMLRQLGHVTAVAYDGPSGLQVAAEFAPEIVLLDIGLPVMDGFEVCGRLRDSASTALIVALTGYGHDSDRKRTKAAGFDAHIVKPITMDLIASILEQRRSLEVPAS